MALQDLTPQLRTRLSRLERVVGWFVTLATLLMIAGFGYYLYATARSKGWFLTKAPYFTYLRSGAGLKVGDTVKLMGFDAGQITQITAEDPGMPYDVYVEFHVAQPYYGYVWDDSRVKVKSAGFLGDRYLEVAKGGTSGSTNKLFASYHENARHALTEIYDQKTGVYANFNRTLKFHLEADEPPELASQMDAVVQTAKNALPHFLALTNQLTRVLNNAADATARLNTLAENAEPLVTNLNVITENLRNPKGSLGEWLISPSLNLQLTQTLASANTTLQSANTAVTNTDARVALLVSDLSRALENLAAITSNLNHQVQVNTNILSEISRLIVNTDDMVQGLKRHWLLRSAFKNKAPGASPAAPSPKRPGAKGAEQLR